MEHQFFAKQVRDETKKDVSKWTYYRAKRFASKAISGDAEIRYGLMWDYCNELNKPENNH